MRLVAKLLGADDRHDISTGRSGQSDVGSNDRHPSPARDRSLGERIALPAGRTVAEVTNRIKELSGASGRNDDVFPGEILCSAVEQLERCVIDRLRVGSRPLPVSTPVSRPTAGSNTR